MGTFSDDLIQSMTEALAHAKTGATTMIKYDKNGRAYASASFTNHSPPASFFDNLRPNPVLIAELVAELMLDVPESY